MKTREHGKQTEKTRSLRQDGRVLCRDEFIHLISSYVVSKRGGKEQEDREWLDRWGYSGGRLMFVGGGVSGWKRTWEIRKSGELTTKKPMSNMRSLCFDDD